jgi:hypothetical protein
MRVLIILFSVFLIVACGKKNQIKVTAKNAATGEGYADLGFRIFEVKPYTTPTGEVQDLVYEGNFNANGEAVADILLKNRSYVITTVSPGPMCYINNTQYFFHRDDENLKFDFRFAPCAYLKLKIENVNCEGGDKLVLYQGNQIGSFNFNQPWEHNGCAFWESNGYSDIPMGEQYYRWEVTRNGVTEEFHDTIYLEENEYKVYEINY